MYAIKLNKFWHQLSSFITLLWDDANGKFMQLMDLQISYGCAQAIKQEMVYSQGQLKLTHITFAILHFYAVKQEFKMAVLAFFK